VKKVSDRALAAAVALGLSALFWALRCRTFGPGDSAQHVAAGLTWGVSRPPGYPLYDALAWAWTRLPWPNPAGAVDGLSGLFAAAAAAVFFLLLRRQRCGRAAALTATGLMALSPLFWYYSEVAEVRALNDLLALAAAYSLFDWLERGGARRAALFGAAFGLGVSHHPTFALLAPAFAWLAWPRRKAASKSADVAALAAAVALAAPYLALWLRLSLAPPPAYNPDGVRTAADVLALFLRRNTGGYFNMFGRARSPLAEFRFADFARHGGWMLSGLGRGLGAAGLAAAAAGAAALWRREREKLVFWELWAVVPAGVFLLISSQQMPPLDPDYIRAVCLRFYLLPMIGLFALAAFGLDWLLARSRPALAWTLVAVAWLGPALGRPVDLRGRDWTKAYAEEIVRASGPRDFVMLAADDSIMGTAYLDVVEHATGDRVFLMPWLFGYPAYIENLARRHPGLTIPRDSAGAVSPRLRDWLAVNPGRGLCAETVDYGPLRREFPHLNARGPLVVVSGADATRAERARQAESFFRGPLAAARDDEAYADTQELYVFKAARRAAVLHGQVSRP